MDQYTNFLDAVYQPIYPSQQSDPTSTTLSPEPQLPSLSASPVSSEGSDSLIDQTVQYDLFAYDQPLTALFGSANICMAGSTPVNGPSSFGYDSHMLFDTSFPPSTHTYQPSIGFDYPVHSNTESSLANMLGDSAPFATVAPSATSPSSSFFCAENVCSSPPTVDSDYSPSGESEVEDQKPSSSKKNRSERVSSVPHPYLKPASKGKGKKGRGTGLEVPIPVPGLTKNSRGRSVPKKTEVVLGTRMFWCSVEGCDKLFSRGEHLKRHVTSIHTNDKPFWCKCGDIFSRRDNLFQHMRARGCVVWYIDGERQVPDDEEDGKDGIVPRIMADAEIAQEERGRGCK